MIFIVCSVLKASLLIFSVRYLPLILRAWLLFFVIGRWSPSILFSLLWQVASGCRPEWYKYDSINLVRVQYQAWPFFWGGCWDAFQHAYMFRTNIVLIFLWWFVPVSDLILPTLAVCIVRSKIKLRLVLLLKSQKAFIKF